MRIANLFKIGFIFCLHAAGGKDFEIQTNQVATISEFTNIEDNDVLVIITTKGNVYIEKDKSKMSLNAISKKTQDQKILAILLFNRTTMKLKSKSVPQSFDASKFYITKDLRTIQAILPGPQILLVSCGIKEIDSDDFKYNRSSYNLDKTSKTYAILIEKDIKNLTLVLTESTRIMFNEKGVLDRISREGCIELKELTA